MSARKLNAISTEALPANVVESGRVSHAPASIEGDAYVILDSLPEQPVGPVLGWRDAPEEGWPQRGDRCAIVTASDGTAWFVGWNR
jgi:hypothetical protein